MEIGELAKKLPYWEKLSASEKEYVKQNAVTRVYKKGSLLRGCGESCLGMLYIVSGSVRVTMISEEGREITLFKLDKGDCCILSASCVLSQITFETMMTAAENTELLIVNSGAFEELMEKNLYVKCFSYELATERLSAVVWVMQQIIFAHFDRRLAQFLLHYSEKSGRDEIHMTQEEIAREVNSAREVVARMLKQFSLEGLIALRRGTILIKDRSGLEKL